MKKNAIRTAILLASTGNCGNRVPRRQPHCRQA